MPFDTTYAPPPDGQTFSKPFQAEAEAVVATQAERCARVFTGGVSWSGLTSPPPEVEDVETVRQRLVKLDADRKAFRATPRGRLLIAIEALEEDCPAEASALRTQEAHLYYSGFGRPGERVQVSAVGRALKVLAPLDCRAAQDAEDALADLLIADAKLAEAA